MLKGEELACTPIKTRNKEGTYELREAHYAINDILYYYNKKDMSGERAMEAYERLCEAGKELKSISVRDNATAKKEEILEALRAICKSLKEFADTFRWEEGMRNDIDRSIRYQVALLKRAKENGKMEDNPIPYLDDIQEIKRTLIDPYYRAFKHKIAIPGTGIYDYYLKEFNQSILKMVAEKYKY